MNKKRFLQEELPSASVWLLSCFTYTISYFAPCSLFIPSSYSKILKEMLPRIPTPIQKKSEIETPQNNPLTCWCCQPAVSCPGRTSPAYSHLLHWPFILFFSSFSSFPIPRPFHDDLTLTTPGGFSSKWLPSLFPRPPCVPGLFFL